jgi:MFS family permease
LEFPFETRTERGLRNMLLGMKTFGAFAALLIIVFFIQTTFGPNPDISLILMASTMGLIAGILVLASFISWIIGFYRIFTGRREYGPVHAHYVNLSSIFAGMYILSLIGMVILLSMAWRLITQSFFLYQLFFGLISTALLSLTWIYLILELVPRELKPGLWISLVVSLIISISSSFIGALSPLAGFLSFALWFIVLFLVIYIYHRTYNRLKKKEILPILPPPMPFPLPPP